MTTDDRLAELRQTVVDLYYKGDVEALDGRRLVACINACAGITTETLAARGAVVPPLEEVRRSLDAFFDHYPADVDRDGLAQHLWGNWQQGVMS